MIFLLGASGYIGRIFSAELRRRGYSFVPLTRKAMDYSNFELLFDYVRRIKPEFLINAAGYPGHPNIDACETHREETLNANTILPQTIARVCLMTNTPWAHISSSSIYNGAKLLTEGRSVVKDRFDATLRRLFEESPDALCGFNEWDEPNFSFRHGPCSFYSGTKALAEEAIKGVGQNYIWRIGLPFNERPEPRNLLWKIQHYPRICDTPNSLSHTDDFVRVCIELWERRVQFGIYNVTNPGALTNRRIIELMQKTLKTDRHFEFYRDDEEFYNETQHTRRSACILDVSKLLATGVRMRPVEEAVMDALQKWPSPSLSPEMAGV